MNVVIFTGGSGNANLIKYIKDISYINLSLLINGYDDGLSTGVVRSANNGMLGPSDFRKNFTYILDDYTNSNINLKKLFEHRISSQETKHLLSSPHNLLLILFNAYSLDNFTKSFITNYFIKGANQLISFTQNFELLNGFNIGNIIISGIYYDTQDFNKALVLLTTQFDLTAKLINITDLDSSKLIAYDSSGNILTNESDIVNYSGNRPLECFYLVTDDDLNKIIKEKYQEERIKEIAKIPEISKEAVTAIENADLIIFGTGTLFSSLLPSYRICQKYLLRSKSKKYLLINNNFDNDINNISFDELLGKIKNEIQFSDSTYFTKIFVDNKSKILQSIYYPNVIVKDISDNLGKHNGEKLWNLISKSIDLFTNFIPILVIVQSETNDFIKSHYMLEIDNFNQNNNYNIKFYIENNENIEFSYNLYLNTSGKIFLNEIINWVNIIQSNNFDIVIGSRFESRKQLINSFKKSIVESKFNYLAALITSYFVSFIYFLRFSKIIPDPLSGIYLTKKSVDIYYENLPDFLKKINKKNKYQIISLPIGFRTFKNVNIFFKLKNVIFNLFRLYV